MSVKTNGWQKDILNNLVDIGMGRTPSRSVPSFWGTGYTWLSIADLKSKFISSSKEQVSPLGASIMSVIPKGSLIMSFKLSIGRLAFAGCDLYTNEAICNFSNYRGVTPEYLYFALQRVDFSLYGKQAVKGYTLNKESLAKIELKLPPIAEQQKIAAVLSDIDALIETQEDLIAKKKDVKAATMELLLTGKKRLPGFSGEWQWDKISDISKITMGHSPSSIFYNTKGIGLPLIQGNADVDDFRRTYIRNWTSVITNSCGKNDIIMSVRAPAGEIAKASFDSCIGRGVCSIKYENDYLYHYLIYKEQEWRKKSAGSTFDSVTGDEVKKFEVFHPVDIDEQQKIATALSDIDEYIKTCRQEAEKLNHQKLAVMHKLLTGEIRLP